MERTRLDVLVEVLGIGKDKVATRNSKTSGKSIDESSNEFIVSEREVETYYDVLKGDELDGRLEDLIHDCFSEEEIEETYGMNESGEPDLSTADINTYLNLVAEKEGYFIYTPQ